MNKYIKMLFLSIIFTIFFYVLICPVGVFAKNNYIADVTSKAKLQVSSGSAWVGNWYNSNASIPIINNTGYRLKISNVDFNAQKTWKIVYDMNGNSRIQNIKETRILNSNGQIANCTISNIYQGPSVTYPDFDFYCTQYYNELIFEFYGSNILTPNPFRNNAVVLYNVVSENDNSDITNRLDVTIKQNQEIIQGNKDLNDNLNKINENIMSTEEPDLEELKNVAGYLPAGPLDSVINLPLTYLNAYNNVLNKQCAPITITLPFVKDKSITLPCMYEYLSKMTGFETFMTWASKITSAIILFKYLVNLYHWVDNQITLRENTWADKDQWGGI